MVAVSNATIERALRLISVERGNDPRDFTLISFGGAGGLHAADLARVLGLAGVIVPLHPGAFSAIGILQSDIVKDVSRSVLIAVPSRGNARGDSQFSPLEFQKLMTQLKSQFEVIERGAMAEIHQDHPNAKGIQAERRIALRYIGQAYELSIPFTSQFPSRFHAEHEIAYGHAQPKQALEVVSLQLRLILPTPKRRATTAPIPHSKNARGALVKRKPVWFGGHFLKTTLYDRQRLRVGARLTGPAIVVEYSSTTVVPPDFACRVDEHLNLRLTQHGD
jgi:N-methylhydantoinase A